MYLPVFLCLCESFQKGFESDQRRLTPERGGEGYCQTLPIRVCAAQPGCDFEAPDYPFQRRFLERGIIFRTHESSGFVSSHLKLFKDRLLLKIRFNALRWLDWIFWGGYLPSLSINYVAMSKDMEKRFPQLYYIKTK